MSWIVLDSNNYVSALIFGANPRVILELTEHRVFTVSVSDPIKTEVARVLALKFSWSKVRIDDAMSYLSTLTHSVIPQQTVNGCIDAADNRILECALESHSQVIVTGDNHC